MAYGTATFADTCGRCAPDSEGKQSIATGQGEAGKQRIWHGDICRHVEEVFSFNNALLTETTRVFAPENVNATAASRDSSSINIDNITKQ